MSQPETRPSLIVRLRDGRDQTAWYAFADRYERFLGHLALRLGVPRDHVPDVTQQILMVTAKSVEAWRPDGKEASFRRWISRVSRNVVIKFMTAQRRQPMAAGGSDVLDLLSEIPGPPDREVERLYQHELIVWAAQRVRSEFAENSWQGFWQTLIEGKEVSDVASALRVSRGSIYMSRARILKRIREEIAEIMQ